MNKISIIGIPLDLGAENLGVDIGPNAFRYLKIVEKLKSSGYDTSDAELDITDLGNIQVGDRSKLEIGNPKLKYLKEILRVSEESASLAYKLIQEKERIVALGGDHSINLGVLSGASVALKGDLGLIYFDAHGDMNTDKTTLSGNIHGMHLASLLGFGSKDLINIFKKGQKIKKQNLLHIGGSDFDQAELDLVKSENLNCIMMFDLLSSGLRQVFETIDKLNSRVKNIWVSMDLDCIDGKYAPGAAIPNKAGLSYREVTTLADYIGKNCNVVGMDLIEYNPLLDVGTQTATLGIELIAKIMGSDYSPYSSYMRENKLK